jgi:hypothetical protein
MDQRHAIGYFFLLLIVIGLGAAWWRASVHWRARRRGIRAFDRRRRERAAEIREHGD